VLCSSNPINTKALDYFPVLRRIRDYFETNYADPISLKKAAAIAGLEPKYFSRMFRAHVGIGFKEWTDLMRVQKAMDFMQREDQSVTSVGYAVGFQSPVTFQRLFKKHARMKPSDFKKAVVKEIGRIEDKHVA
jgi:two-component system, response regulator YesN